jgi:hypothetical protein
MASNYTGLGVQLMTTGEKAGTWGTLTNTNWNIIEQISGGYTAQAVTDGADTDLSVSDGSTGATLAHRILNLTGSLTSGRNVTIPLDVQTFYIIKNATSGSQIVTFKYVTGSGSSVAIANGETVLVYATANDGTNPDIVDAGFGTGISAVVDDTTPQLGGNLDVNGNSIVSTSNGNIPLAPNGTGEVLIGSGSAAGDLTSSGAYDLIIDTNTGTNAGNITLSNGANGDISFTNNGTGNVVFNDAAYAPETSLTDAVTITWDAQAMPITKVTLTDNRTLAAPSNGQAGQFISLLVIQDAGGTNTLAWNAVFEFPSETAPTLTATGDLADLFVFRYHNSKWLQVGSTLALTVA